MDDTSRTGRLTDEEFGELGKSLGLLVHNVMRARHDNPEAGAISVLSTLAKCGPVRSSELAQTLFLDLSTVSRHVQNLERSGYVEKVADPTDGRAMTLHLTPEGKDHIEHFWRRRTEMMRDGLSHWDAADLRTFAELLGRYAEDFVAIIAKNPKPQHGAPLAAENPNVAENLSTAEHTVTAEDMNTAQKTESHP
jgi:DNA-binding MarR family transcriptional regulator